MIYCEKCGKERVTTYQGVASLCGSCAESNKWDDNYRNYMSEIHTGHKDSEKTKQTKRESQIERWSDPDEHIRASNAHIKSYQDDPSIGQRITESLKLKYAEMDDPGEQICMHHYIYDFDDLDKYRIPVTRSEHGRIHANLRKAGLEVPCINILKEEYREV